jgi:hypothetical protein
MRAISWRRGVVFVTLLLSAFGAMVVRPDVATALYGDRITIANGQFKTGSQRVWMNGLNIPWNAWNDFGGTYSSTWWNQAFQDARNSGVNAIRVWITSNGEVGINISAAGAVSGATAQHWSDLDDLFTIAKNNRIYVMATLLTQNHFLSGHSNYASWQNMLNTDANIDSYVNNYVTPFVNRYKSNPFLWSIDLMNEPEYASTDESGPASWVRLQTYFAKAAQAIHTAQNSGILVTVGMAKMKYNATPNRPNSSPKALGNKVSDAALQSRVNTPSAKLDFYASHWYIPDYSQWFSPFDRTPTTYGIDTDKPNMVGESPGKGPYTVSTSATDPCVGNTQLFAGLSAADNAAQAYEAAYSNGWQGVLSWKVGGSDDGCGSSSTYIQNSTSKFRANHGDIVTPAAGTIDDASLGTTTNKFNYVGGGWSHCTTGCGNFGFFRDSQSWATATGDFATIRFYGTQIAYYAVRAPDVGFAAVSIDNGPESNVDLYGTPKIGNQLVWTSSTLAVGYHTMKIRYTGTKNPLSTFANITIDRVDIARAAEPGSIAIYSDSTTWDNWSWTTSVDFNNQVPVVAGKSMAVSYTAPYAGLALRKAGGLSTSGLTRLTFMINGGATGTRQLALVVDTDGGVSSPSMDFDAPAGIWTLVSVDLSQLGNPPNIGRFKVQDRIGAVQPTFYIDEVRLAT